MSERSGTPQPLGSARPTHLPAPGLFWSVNDETSA